MCVLIIAPVLGNVTPPGALNRSNTVNVSPLRLTYKKAMTQNMFCSLVSTLLLFFRVSSTKRTKLLEQIEKVVFFLPTQHF